MWKIAGLHVDETQLCLYSLLKIRTRVGKLFHLDTLRCVEVSGIRRAEVNVGSYCSFVSMIGRPSTICPVSTYPGLTVWRKKLISKLLKCTCEVKLVCGRSKQKIFSNLMVHMNYQVISLNNLSEANYPSSAIQRGTSQLFFLEVPVERVVAVYLGL